MQVERTTAAASWDGTVPSAFDWRVVGLVVVLAALAASFNLPHGGPAFAAGAFVLLTAGGLAAHALGERRLRRITTGLAERWDADGARIESVSGSAGLTGTEWTIRTASGPVVVRGLALAPLSKLSIEWQGTGDVLEASDAEARLDALAEEWYREVVEFPSA
ncbi:hypothetical protein [Halovivax sp.]|uniref:hypothetical protein n=1 Tax=Halovivax sp. TaxID=1935978 RepID=UPI0025BE2BEC|nr:hypothetical protein [Halovivax sp.]